MFIYYIQPIYNRAVDMIEDIRQLYSSLTVFTGLYSAIMKVPNNTESV